MKRIEHNRSIAWILTFGTAFTLLINSAISERLPGEILFKNRKNIDISRDMMGEDDRRLAMAAAGSFLRAKSKELGSDSVATALEEFVDAGKDIDETAFIASLIAKNKKHRESMISKLLESDSNELEGTSPSAFGRSSGDRKTRLAAALLAFNAVEMNLPSSEQSKGNRSGYIPVPSKLLESDDEVAQKYALTAAALAGQEDVKDAVLAIKGKEADVLGAKLLYMANTDMEIKDRMVKYVFEKTLSQKRRASSFQGRGRQDQDVALYNIIPPGGVSACRALAALGDKKYIPLLYRALENEDSRVQIEAVRALETLWEQETMKVILNRLGNCDWKVAVEICNLLNKHLDQQAVPALINRLAKETGYLRAHLVYSLSSIAGGQKGKNAEEWKEWWTENQSGFSMDAEASKAYMKRRKAAEVSIPEVGYFYGLPIISDRFVYVVDSSNSMRGEKIESLRENLTSSIENLKPIRSKGDSPSAAMRGRQSGSGVYYNIADFGGRVEIMEEDELVSRKSEGVDYAEEFPRTAGTRMYGAIDLALSVPNTDTLYLLTDGAPIAGALDNWERIIRGLRFLTRYRPIAIHGVAFNPRNKNERRMKTIAEENYGRYSRVN